MLRLFVLLLSARSRCRPLKAKWDQIIRSVDPGWNYSDAALNELRIG